MKNQIKILTAIVALAFCGCAVIQPGEDPIVVRAEQTAEIATETIDGFLLYERQNRDALWEVSHDFKHFADKLRINAAPAIQSLRTVTRAYKASRELEDRDALVSALAVVQSLLAETQDHFARTVIVGQ